MENRLKPLGDFGFSPVFYVVRDRGRERIELLSGSGQAAVEILLLKFLVESDDVSSSSGLSLWGIEWLSALLFSSCFLLLLKGLYNL